MYAIKDRAPTDQVIIETYQRICDEAPSWLSVSLRIEREDFITFQQWCRTRVSHIIEHGPVLVFLTHGQHPLATDFHPCFLQPPTPLEAHLGYLHTLIDYIHGLGYHRIATTLTHTTGKTIRRILRSLGFEKEGIIRGWIADYDKNTSNYALLDSEFWSILIEGD